MNTTNEFEFPELIHDILTNEAFDAKDRRELEEVISTAPPVGNWSPNGEQWHKAGRSELRSRQAHMLRIFQRLHEQVPSDQAIVRLIEHYSREVTPS
ncbi:MAG TPA: hypothetical protein VGR95_07985 [Thermoanaerobaculia bacterium]|jgi:hypothetical protein|nr:hypothetical protein [Thermoanaerobaculia bacterium]